MNGNGNDADGGCVAKGKKRFFGRYKGTVVTNIDPLHTGRILVTVPDVLGNDPCLWAESASPLAGTAMGLYFVPPIKSGVWIEFQQGDIDYPIWTGCWRGSTVDAPPIVTVDPPVTPPIVLGTTGQNFIKISDVPGPTGGILIQSRSGASISVTDAGIIISNGKGATITMIAGPQVDINRGALTVLM
jgi:uncharacterized protein involved in type VI secretion and phage assembly